MKALYYHLDIEWTGNQGSGTFDYRSYNRCFTIKGHKKSQTIEGSSDPVYLGDERKFNPEELLIASVSNCHMLWYLSLCSKNGVVVTSYKDKPMGVLATENGIEKITHVELNPEITITEESAKESALSLHKTAHEKCFISNSVNFRIDINPIITVT